MAPPTEAVVPDLAENPDRELTPAEVEAALLALKDRYCTQLKEKLGICVVFPPGTMMGDTDVSGKSLEQVLDMIMAPLQSYQPPIVTRALQEAAGAEAAPEKPKIPVWLEGHEDLIWTGAVDNPIWEVQGKQEGKEVTITYVRRGKMLKPGREQPEQYRKLEAIEDKFSITEWKIVKQLIDEYTKLQKKSETPGDGQKTARKEILAVLQEENKLRDPEREVSGQSKLRTRVEEIADKIEKTTRGFKKVDIDMDMLTQRAAEMLSQLVLLNRTRGDGREHIPVAKTDIKEFPSFQHSLSILTERLAEQKTDRKGITLMLGEPGTGKNEAVEYFAAQTKRPYFWFPCGRGMETTELVSHYEYTPGEGTKRFLTSLSEGIQTPGAVVLIDEVNALRPEVQAILHGLGDANRALKIDGVFIPVAQDVLIVIAGNPATCGASTNLGQALLSRTRGKSMVMDYPALRKGDLEARKQEWTSDYQTQKETMDNTLRDYACDEVLVIYPQLNEFRDLTDAEFSLLWDCVVNETTQGTRITDLEKNETLKGLLAEANGDHVRKTLVDLRDILEIADGWRRRYETHQGEFALLGVSMRDTIAIAKKYAQTRNVRTAFLRVYDDFRKNPIDGTDSVLTALETLINEKIGAA